MTNAELFSNRANGSRCAPGNFVRASAVMRHPSRTALAYLQAFLDHSHLEVGTVALTGREQGSLKPIRVLHFCD